MENIKDEYIKKNELLYYNEVSSRSGDNYFEEEVLKIKREMLMHSRIASMNEVVVSDDSKFIIGTSALDTCFGLIFYDRKRKKGIVGHICPPDLNWVIVEMFKKLNLDEDSTIEYQIISGYRAIENNDFKTVDEILDYLKLFSSVSPKTKFVPINGSIDVNQCNGLLAYEFAFDVKTGKSVTSYLFYEPKSSRKML